jgi:thioredoxin-dependent peroxiredoxin
MTATEKAKKTLKEGDKAPDFQVTADNGEQLSLADFRGKNLVLYFYPKANTPG